MEICEYDNISCPYCKGDNLVAEGRKTELNQHWIHCMDCGGDFFIPCED